MASVVLSALKLPRLGVNGDTLAVRPMVLGNSDVVAPSLQPGDSFRREAMLHKELVGLVLVVEARSVHRLLNVQPAFRCGKEMFATVVIMRAPPGEPNTYRSFPSSSTIVGVMELSGRLPGAMALAGP